MKKGKRYNEIAKLVDKSKLYEVNEAIDLALQTATFRRHFPLKTPKLQTATAKFDETLELHVKLGVDGRDANQQVRGVVVLPNGTGKTIKVLVIAKGTPAEVAEKSGADYVGAEEIVAKLKGDEQLMSKFQSDPVKTVEGLVGVDLPADQIGSIVEAVKAKLGSVSIFEKIGKLFGKK